MRQLVKLNKRPSSDGTRFSYYLRYVDEKGTRRWKGLGHSNMNKAERQRAKLQRELKMGFVEPGSMRLREFTEDSIATTGDQIRESTRIDYQEAMDDFITVIGNVDCQIVRQIHGEFFRQVCLDRGGSPATVAKKLRELKRFFCLAVQRKQLHENPLQYVKLPKVPKQRIKIYTGQEMNRILKAASQVQNDSILEWDLLITLAITTGMRKSEMLNMVWSDIDFSEMTIEVSPKGKANETWEWRIKDTDRRFLPLKEDVSQLLIHLQDRRPQGYPYVLVPPGRYDHIQQVLRPSGRWTLSSARNKVINNFTKQFNKILATAHVDKRTFHDIRKTAITNWFRQGLSEYDVMTLAGHASFATTHQVSQRLLQKCCQSSQRGERP